MRTRITVLLTTGRSVIGEVEHAEPRLSEALNNPLESVIQLTDAKPGRLGNVEANPARCDRRNTQDSRRARVSECGERASGGPAQSALHRHADDRASGATCRPACSRPGARGERARCRRATAARRARRKQVRRADRREPRARCRRNDRARDRRRDVERSAHSVRRPCSARVRRRAGSLRRAPPPELRAV
jgi:hypothetical protein